MPVYTLDARTLGFKSAANHLIGLSELHVKSVAYSNRQPENKN